MRIRYIEITIVIPLGFISAKIFLKEYKGHNSCLQGAHVILSQMPIPFNF